MSVEQFVAILGALATLIGAVAILIGQVRRTHELVNSRMTELLALTKQSALAEGALSVHGLASGEPPMAQDG